MPVERILAITFTEKAAAELRTRVRRRFLELGRRERGARGRGRLDLHDPRLLRARCCARTRSPRASTPTSGVLDELEAERLAVDAFDRALEDVPAPTGTDARRGLELVAAYTPGQARATWCARPTRSCAAGASAAARSRPAGAARAGGRARRGWRRRARGAAPSSAAPATGVTVARGDRAARALPGACSRRLAAGRAGRARRARGKLRSAGSAKALCTARAARSTARRSPPTPRSALARREHRDHELLRELLELYGERYEAAKRDALGARLRGPRAARARPAARADAGPARALRRALRARAGRRVPGHEPAAERAARAARRETTCSASATRTSRSTASATPTWRCSASHASGPRPSGRAREHHRELPQRAARCSTRSTCAFERTVRARTSSRSARRPARASAGARSPVRGAARRSTGHAGAGRSARAEEAASAPRMHGAPAWRAAEARLLAKRIDELTRHGRLATGGDVVVLLRATTSMARLRARAGGARRAHLRGRRARLLEPAAGGRPAPLAGRAGQPARRAGALLGAGLAAGRARRSTRWR